MELAPLLDDFPPLCFAFAYGSAVFSQRGGEAALPSEPMTDLVFCTPHTEAWHSRNLRAHAHHYSSLSLGGARLIAAVQERVGAGVYYNPLLRVRGRLIKYGVVHRADLIDDLRGWTSLYLSGRLHKPVSFLVPPCAELADALAANTRGGLAAALLLLPPRFDEAELFSAICRLSYDGDVRMGVGENWSKVDRIVAGQLDHLRLMYAAAIAELRSARVLSSGASSVVTRAILASDPSESCELEEYQQDMSLDSRLRLVDLVPSNARRELALALQRSASGCHRGGMLEMAHVERAVESHWIRSADQKEANQKLSAALHRSLFKIVRRASLAQTLKGIATAGVLKSASYACTKIVKRFQR
ncbi:MAG: hypothetical protein SGPRY_011395 [Prymnesium sp.]